MKVLDYKTYLRGQHWQYTRKMALRLAHHECKNCGTCGSILSGLQVHHSVYDLGREKLRDLVVLCADCHAIKHGVGHVTILL